MRLRNCALALLLLNGCSFLSARNSNDPRVGCSRTPGRADAVLGLIGVAGFATSIYYFGEPEMEAHTSGNPMFVITALPSVALAVVSAVQAGYGLSVANRCEAERARIKRRPL
ncbi:MAG: hypothetical protein ACKV2T_17465 [Kofleriaceae bacterium]